MFRSTLAVGLSGLVCAWSCSSPVATNATDATNGTVGTNGTDGTKATNHRVNDAQCLTPIGQGNCSCTTCSGPEFTCKADADCKQGVHGRCIGHGGGPAGCFCTYDKCSGDSGCANGSTCACRDSPYMGSSGNQCVPGNCRVDSDCGKGGSCSPSGAWSVVGYYCHTPTDTCTNDDDCPIRNCSGTPTEPRCVYSASVQSWQCQCIPFPL